MSNSECIGIDPYISYVQNDISDKNLYDCTLNVSQNQKFLDNMFNRLNDNINNFNLSNVKIIRDFSKNISIIEIDILHINGNHDFEPVLQDLNINKNNINLNGIIIMDDANWDSVNKAMIKFLELNKNFKIVERLDNYTILKKISYHL